MIKSCERKFPALPHINDGLLGSVTELQETLEYLKRISAHE